MHTVIAFQEGKPTDPVTDNINGVPDQHIRVEDEVIYISDLDQIIGVYCGGVPEILSGYLASPSLRRLANYAMSPVDIALEPLNSAGYTLHPLSPVSLEKNEGLEAIITASATVGTGVTTVGVLLSDAPVVPIVGEIFHVRATGTLTALAEATWQNGDFDFDDTLPVGRYQIVGARAHINGGILFRFVPIGAFHRPGGICVGTIEDIDPFLQRNGGLGVWCEFDQITPPSIDVLCGETTGGTALELHIDLIKIG